MIHISCLQQENDHIITIYKKKIVKTVITMITIITRNNNYNTYNLFNGMLQH